MENRRKTIVVNKGFQQHYALILVAMTILLTNFFIIFSMLFPGAEPLELSSSNTLIIGLVELLLVSGVWYASIRATHRIAGPVYVITRELAQFGQGNLAARVRLREDDMFREEAEAINVSLAALCERVEAVHAAARALQAAQATGADTGARLEELMQVLDGLRCGGEG